MRGPVVFMLTQNDKSLSVKGMKRVGDRDFVSQNPGTMNCLPMVQARTRIMIQLQAVASTKGCGARRGCGGNPDGSNSNHSPWLPGRAGDGTICDWLAIHGLTNQTALIGRRTCIAEIASQPADSFLNLFSANAQDWAVV